MNREVIQKLEEEKKLHPYDYCSECEMSARNGGHCHVYDKYQRLPRDKYRGALGQCMKIGGRGC